MLSLALIAVATLGASCQSSQPAAHPPPVEHRVYQWLVAQQSPTGLVGNQEDDDFSGLYANALAALCYTHEGDFDGARKLFEHFNRQYSQDFAGFPQFWNARTGQAFADSDRWIGDNAWLLIALNHYRRMTDDARFDDLRAGIARWLLSLQDADGGVLSGFNKAGPMTHKSTEGNLDCYAALTDHPEARARVLDWLKTKMWVAGEQRLRMGSSVDESPLDATSWGIAALGSGWTNLLPYAEQHFVRADVCAANGKSVTGFADFLGKQRIWFEGTGQMVVAYNVAGQFEKADRYLHEMESVMLRSAQFPETLGLPCMSSDPPWKTGAEKIFVPSQAWYLFGKWRFNPMAPDAGMHEAKP